MGCTRPHAYIIILPFEVFIILKISHDKEIYLNRLRLNRLTPESYETMKRQELIVQKLRRLIELSVDTSGIDSQIQVSGDEQIVNMVKEQMLNDRKQKAVKSFIEGAKNNIKVVIHKDLIS